MKQSTNLRTTAKELVVPERRFVRFLLEQRFVYRTASGNVLPYVCLLYTSRQRNLERMLSYDLLIIDDLGAQRSTEYMMQPVSYTHLGQWVLG